MINNNINSSVAPNAARPAAANFFAGSFPAVIFQGLKTDDYSP